MAENLTENLATHHETELVEVKHEATLYAEKVSEIGSLPITNSLINSWITVIILVIFFILVGKNIKRIPKGIQNIFEFLLEKALNLADSISGSREKSEKFLPFCLTIFLFVLINNWLGLLPGIGTIGFIESEKSHSLFIPFFRGGTADINTTLALALFSVVISHIFGAVSIGVWNHINKYVNFKVFLAIPGEIKKDFFVIFVNPIKAFVGVVEIIGEVAKVASLSFRLFGNIFAGEVLLASMMALFAYILPLPFIFLEIIVGLIQALIFAMLTLVFMVIATSSHEPEKEH